DAGGPGGTLENQVTAASDAPDGTTVTDLSDSGTDPNTTNTGEDGDTGGSNDSTPLEIPNVGVAKAVVGSPVQSGTSQFEFDVTYRLVLENTGNVTLTGMDLVDDVTTAFGTTLLSIDTPPAIASHTVAVPANLPTLNAGWAADTSLSVFNDDGTIAPGETITVEYTLTMDSRPSGGATLFNQAAFTTDDPDTGVEAGPTDLSDAGSDPDTSNTGSPGDLGTTDDPTPVVLPNASVGVAKNATWDDANDTATFVFTLEHFGSTAMLNMSMTEDLDLILGAGNYVASTPVLVSGPATIGVNTLFDGSADPELINPGSSLAVGETAVIQVDVSVTTIADPQSNGLGMFENQVTLTGEDSSGNTYADDSVDGTDPDPDMDNDPTNDGSISNGNLTPDGTIGVAKDATVAPDVMSMTFDFYLEHLGNTEAFNISLTEDLDAVFGAGAYTVTSVSLTSGPATISENGTFDGSAVQELVAPGSSMLPGETAQIQVALNLNMVFGQFSNQADIQSEDVDGNTYTDQSTSGTEPDPDMDDDPTNNNETTDFVVASGEINGTVYVDQNDNGTIDMGEVPIEGVTITLTGTDILGNPVSETTTTAADGTYEFTDLLPGDYTVTQTHPTDYYDGQETLGDGGGSAGSDSFMVTLNAANSFTANAYNFGELGLNPAAVGKSLLLVSGAGSGGLIPPLSGGEGATEPIVSVEGNRLTITSQGDYNEIVVRADTSFHRLRLDNSGYDFDASEITEIVVNASETDFVTIEASELDDRVVLRPGGGVVRSTAYSVEVNRARNISIDGQAGNDLVFFVDSAQDDIFESTTFGSSMRDTAQSYLNHAVRFELITGNSIVGGSDVANLVDTSGDDRLNATLGFATFSTPDREYRMNKFESVEIRQQNGGEDFIVLNDSPMPDTLTVRSGQTRFANEQYDVTAVGFNRVAAYSRKSTDDRATFFDSTGNDVFVAKADYARLSTETGRFEASQFAVTEAYALSGGNDRAELFDTAEDDQFVARDNYSLLSNSESTMRAVNFELVTGYANHGGDDVALLYGSDGDDRFVANGSLAEISSDNRRVRSVGFERVLGESQGRGNDLAILLGSTGQDTVTSQQNNVRLDSTNGVFNARQFSHVFALGGEAHDEIVFEDLSDDAELRASAMTVQLNASSRSIRAIDFGIVHANADEDATPMSVLDAIDFVFHQNGTWM
ncbi:MAG: SdrD B-like domain-containing protein, partial [Planctomycetota bacterium]